MKHITVLIPCYNEAAGIADVITGFPRERLERLGYALDVLIVDNNSSDDTAKVAAAAGARVIHEPKQGKGNAMRTGFYNLPTHTDYVVMCDGDNTYRPDEILRMIEPIDSGFCDAVVGSRMYGRIADGSMTRLNRFGNFVFTQLVRRLYGARVTDVLSGYFAWSRQSIERLRPHLASEGFALEMEMVTKMTRLGEAVYSVPISYEPRAGQANLRPFRDGLRVLGMLLRTLFWQPSARKEPAPVRSDA